MGCKMKKTVLNYISRLSKKVVRFREVRGNR